MVTSPSTPTAAHEDVGADEVGGHQHPADRFA
ncbi:transcriptional regulator, partial [Escherichia coli]|nr:transcriptional regulator [Escherichia coli]